MYFTVNDISQLNDILNRIGAKVQLNKSRRDRAESSYRYICNWIQDDPEYFGNYDLEFYSQGSYKIGTTVKPLSGDEFDLDFVLQIKSDWYNENPISILNNLEKRLKCHDVYKPKVERKTRCIRINYENEFHIDILPGIPENKNLLDTKLKVPDREKKGWTDGNPKGFASWFESKANNYNRILLEKRYASIEPLPDEIPYELIDPLKRIVQLMKRYRDIYYVDKVEDAPRSIIITTLAAINYDGELSEYDGILNILYKIKKQIISYGNKPIEIYNPTNEKEKLSEKWDDDIVSYKEFCNFIDEFILEWNNLKQLETFEEKAQALKILFGESITNEALKEQADYISKLRSNNFIAIDTNNGMIKSNRGLSLGESLKGVRKNTFYGE